MLALNWSTVDGLSDTAAAPAARTKIIAEVRKKENQLLRTTITFFFSETITGDFLSTFFANLGADVFFGTDFFFTNAFGATAFVALAAFFFTMAVEDFLTGFFFGKAIL
jgi:hypothetical protein